MDAPGPMDEAVGIRPEEIHVLHVDDTPEMSELVEIYLEREADALEVETVTSARAALDYIADDERPRVDCVVSDYNMPETTGLELLEAVRETHPDLPFVLFTGKGSEEIASEAISAGVTDYLQKQGGTEQYAMLANRITNAVEGYRARQARQESEERYRTLVEQSHDAIYVVQNGAFAFVNDRACEISGYDRSELLGMSYTEVLHPDDRGRVAEIATDREQGRDSPGAYKLRVLTADGEIRHLEQTVQAITLDGDYATLGFARDVTDRVGYHRTIETLHTATRDLMRAETRLDVCGIVVETARDELDLPITGCWLYDEDREVLDPATCTDEGRDLFGEQPVFEPGGSLAWDAFEAGETAVYDDVRERDGIYNPETTVRSEILVPLGRQGLLVTGSTETESFTDVDRSFLDLLAANATVALERAERETALREREARLDEFSSVVSHDLRSPLNIVEGMIALTRETGDRSHLDTAQTAVDRMTDLIGDLLALARQGKVVDERESVSLASVAESAWTVCESDGSDLAIDVREDRRLDADPSRLQTLFENLFRNAVEHAGEPVGIEIGTLEDGFYVADDGPGIPEAERGTLFEGETGRSGTTGLGLLIVARVADAHGWSITATESETGGTRIEVTDVDSLDG